MQNDASRKKSIILAIIGYTIFGFSLFFSQSALSVTTPIVLLAIRFLVAFAILNVMLLFKPFSLNIKGKGKKLLPLLLLGLTQPVVYFICETYSVSFLPTSLVGIITSICPIASIVFGALLLKEKVTYKKLIFVVISVLGVILTTLGEEINGSITLLGVLLAFGAVIAATAFNLLSRFIKEEFTAFEKTYVMFLLGSVVFTALALITAKGSYVELIFTPLKSLRFWLDVIYLAGFSSVGAFFAINYSYAKLRIQEVVVFNSLSTVISIVAGVLFLSEPFGVYQIVGSILVVLGVVFAGLTK